MYLTYINLFIFVLRLIIVLKAVAPRLIATALLPKPFHPGEAGAFCS